MNYPATNKRQLAKPTDGEIYDDNETNSIETGNFRQRPQAVAGERGRATRAAFF